MTGASHERAEPVTTSSGHELTHIVREHAGRLATALVRVTYQEDYARRNAQEILVVNGLDGMMGWMMAYSVLVGLLVLAVLALLTVWLL